MTTVTVVQEMLWLLRIVKSFSLKRMREPIHRAKDREAAR